MIYYPKQSAAVVAFRLRLPLQHQPQIQIHLQAKYIGKALATILAPFLAAIASQASKFVPWPKTGDHRLDKFLSDEPVRVCVGVKVQARQNAHAGRES